MTEKKKFKNKKLKSLADALLSEPPGRPGGIRFHSAIKINNYNRGGGGGGEEKSKRNYRSQNIRIINVFLESLLSGSFPWESQSTSPT